MSLYKQSAIDGDGKIIFTGKVPPILKNDRTEFVLQDLAGNEKILSLRIQEIENRKIAEIVKLTMGNTPMDVKLGETITAYWDGNAKFNYNNFI